MAALNWSKWGRDFLFSVMRHVGTAGMTWVGLSLQDKKLDMEDVHQLWIAVLVGGVLPTLFTALQSPPDETVVVVETKDDRGTTTTTSTIAEPTKQV